MFAWGVPYIKPQPAWEPDPRAVEVVAGILQCLYSWDNSEQTAKRILMELHQAGLH